MEKVGLIVRYGMGYLSKAVFINFAVVSSYGDSRTKIFMTVPPFALRITCRRYETRCLLWSVHDIIAISPCLNNLRKPYSEEKSPQGS